MHLDAAQLEFMERLGKTPDGQQLKSILLREIEDSNMRLRTLKGDALLNEQGRATTLDELVSRLSQKVPARRPIMTKAHPSLAA